MLQIDNYSVVTYNPKYLLQKMLQKIPSSTIIIFQTIYNIYALYSHLQKFVHPGQKAKSCFLNIFNI